MTGARTAQCHTMPDAPAQGRWRGWTFFRLSETNHVGASSSGRRRLRPDVVEWNPLEGDRAWQPPAQLGRSTAAQRRGQAPAERGATTVAPASTGQYGGMGPRPRGPPTWSSAKPLGPMGHLLQRHPLYGVFGAIWGIDGIKEFHADAYIDTGASDSEGKHGADEAYGQSEQVERWVHLEREGRGEHSRGDIACASSSAATSPTATEDSLLGGEPWGCRVSDPDLWDFLRGATMEASSTYEEQV